LDPTAPGTHSGHGLSLEHSWGLGWELRKKNNEYVAGKDIEKLISPYYTDNLFVLDFQIDQHNKNNLI